MHKPFPKGDKGNEYCRDAWDYQLGMGPRHTWDVVQVSHWEGYGIDMPDSYRQTISPERFGGIDGESIYWIVQIIFEECRDCKEPRVRDWCTNYGLVLEVPIENVIFLGEEDSRGNA